jgi:hypothetical protein
MQLDVSDNKPNNDVQDWLNGPGSTVIVVIIIVMALGLLWQIIKAVL